MEANWSPDNQRVAFWLQTKPELCPNDKQGWVNLAVLDIQTQQVINYCVSGEAFSAPDPVWSLDGRYIAVHNYLVDPDQGWAAPISGIDIWPIGWLNAP